MLTNLKTDFQRSDTPFAAGQPKTIVERLARLESAHDALVKRHVDLIEGLSKHFEDLNRSGVLTIADAVIDGTPIGATSPSTGKFTTLEATTSSTFPTGTTTPTPAAGSGTFTSASASLKWTKIGNRTLYEADVTITTNGTAAGYVVMALPSTPATSCGAGGKETGVSQKGLAALAFTDGNLYIHFYDGTYPGANGAILRVNGHYDT